MRVVAFIRRRWGLWALLAIYAYLTVHMLSGSEGWASWRSAERDAVALRGDVERLSAERELLRVRAAAMGSQSLQLDVADSNARRKLFVAREGEMVILRAERTPGG